MGTKVEKSTVMVSSSRTNHNDVTTWTRAIVPLERVATGVGVPNYRYKIRHALGAVSNFSASYERYELRAPCELGGGWFSSDNHIPSNWQEDVLRGYPSTGAAWSNSSMTGYESANQQALQQIWSRAIAARRSMQTGTLLGEIRQTVGMVRSRSKSMMSLFTRWNDDLRRSKRYTRRKEDARKKASDAWLEFAFGWAPLAGDIRTGLDIFANPRREGRRIKGNGTSVSDMQQTEGGFNSVGPVLARPVNKAYGVVDVQYGGYVAAEVPGIGGKLDRLGLLPNDFVPTVYNLMPWTFLVDYFSNLGGIVDALCFPTSGVRWEYQTIRKRQVKESSMTFAGPSASALIRRNTEFTRTTPSSTYSERGTVARVNIDYLPIPRLDFKLPGLARQWVNMSALIAARKYKYWP